VKDRIIESFQGLLDSVVAATPKVVTGIVLLILAVVVAKIVEKLLRAVLVRVKFDSLLAKAGVDKALQRIGIRQQLNQFIPRVVYFLLLLLFAKTVSDAVGLVAVSDAFGAFFAYLPNIIAALLLLVLGSAAAQFAGDAVHHAAESAGIDFARSLGRVVSTLIVFIVGMMAISQLKIETNIVRIVTSFLLGAGALAFGLSFGLGTRDITRNIVAGFYARRILEVGQLVEIAGRRGVVKAVTPTHTLIEEDDRTLSIANARFLDEIARQ
jgi:small-conductance mechanosensitive channel